jgi:hypothetical protein
LLPPLNIRTKECDQIITALKAELQPEWRQELTV